MWEEVKICLAEFFETHRARKFGFVLGVTAGAAFLIFGFFNTLFALFCGLIGLYIGARLDRGDDLIEKTLKTLEEVLPERLQRW